MSFKFKEAFDKDPHAVVTFAVHTLDEDGEEVAYNEMTSFVRGAGGWGGDRGPSADINVPPTREPDAIIEEKTDANQTLLYRLSGDWNPLHADPAFAKAFGFDKPILHGMCTFGYCGRHVIKAFSNNDPRYFKSIKVRFAKSVFPGETLVTKMWKESDTRIVFETSVKERNEVVIKNAAVELYSEIPAAKSKAKVVTESPVDASGVDEDITLADVFAGIKSYVAAKPELVEQTKTSFQFVFHNPESTWFIDLKNGEGSVGSGAVDKPDVTIELDTEHSDTLFGGDLAAVQKLYFGGKMKVHGNVMASNKLSVLSSMDKSLVEAARTARLASGASAEQTASITTSARPSFAEQLMANLPQKPLSAGQCQGVMQLRVSAPESAWVINVSASGVSVTAGETDAETVVSVADEHLEALSRGERKLADLYQRGELTVDGDVSLARALDALVAQ